MGGVVGEIQKILFFHWNSMLKIFPPLGVLHHHIPTPSSGSLVHRITGGFFSELLYSPLAVLCSMRNSFLLSLTSVSSVQSLSRVWLSATPWTAACQGYLSITSSWSLLKLMSIELVMPYNHFLLCHPCLLLASIFQHQGLSQWVSSSHQGTKVLELQLQRQSFQWILRTDFL